jgi:hypothetical protein
VLGVPRPGLAVSLVLSLGEQRKDTWFSKKFALLAMNEFTDIGNTYERALVAMHVNRELGRDESRPYDRTGRHTAGLLLLPIAYSPSPIA